MFVLCVVSKDRKTKYRRVKAQNQVRMKHRVQDNTKKIPPVAMSSVSSECCHVWGRHSDWLRAGRSGDRIPLGARFFADRPWGLPSLLYNDIGSFPGGKAAGA